MADAGRSEYRNDLWQLSTVTGHSLLLAPRLFAGQARPGRQIRGQAAMAGEAGRSFAGGFFGCFGVIAAGVAMLFGLAFCAGLDSHRTDGRLADEDFRGSDYLSMCAAASVEVERGWRLGQVEASVDSPLLDAPGPPLRIRCAMNSSRKGAIEAVVTVRCANPLERSCHKVESVSTGALAVRAVP